MNKEDPQHPCNVSSEELYKRTTQELLVLARTAGVKFPINYPLPYTVSSHKVNSDKLYRYNIEDHSEAWEHYRNHPNTPMMELHSILCRQSCVTNFFNKERAEEFKDLRNKRHIICAMKSNDPNFPVLI